MKAFLLFLHFIAVVPVVLSVQEPVPHKYHLIKKRMTWTAAQTYCRKTFEDLATVESDPDWERLKTEVAREGVADVAWVGLYNDIKSWRWSFNDVPLENTYKLWNYFDSQPDNEIGHICGLTGIWGYWWDFPCMDLYPFICYDANNDYANRFVGIPTKVTWHEAQAHCREFHTDLATATNKTDNKKMQQIAYSQGFSWIGLYRDEWKWSDGTNTSSIQWGSGQPDNINKNENCAVASNGTLGDRKCDQGLFFICHTTRPVREQQTVKLQVKSGGSLFNPEVQVAILQSIRKKLEEKGVLVNTTVTWKVQSNGQIFQKRKETGL